MLKHVLPSLPLSLMMNAYGYTCVRTITFFVGGASPPPYKTLFGPILLISSFDLQKLNSRKAAAIKIGRGKAIIARKPSSLPHEQ